MNLWAKFINVLAGLPFKSLSISVPIRWTGYKKQMLLRRLEFTDISTIGELTFGDFKCWTLEDTVRDLKIAGKTAIPAGRYQVIVTYSTRFKRDMPLLLQVPGFDGVRIHSGNTDQQTEGCILLGYLKDKNWIGDSKKACDQLQPLIEAHIKKEPLWLTITGGREAKV